MRRRRTPREHAQHVLLLSLARLEPPLSWLDWFHYQTDRVWIIQYRHANQSDLYRVRPQHAADLRHLGLIEPISLGWNRDRYVLTPAGLWLLIHQGRPERRQARLERAAHATTIGYVERMQPVRQYTPPSEWRKRQEGSG